VNECQTREGRISVIHPTISFTIVYSFGFQSLGGSLNKEKGRKKRESSGMDWRLEKRQP
jgi:hypothetical protein